MHQCEEFRERITEHIIEREDITKRMEFQRELRMCQGCSDFYAESKEMIEALSSADFAWSEDDWSAMIHRLRMRIVSERLERPAPPQRLARGFRVYASAAAGAAALVMLTAALYRLVTPISQPPGADTSGSQYVYVDRN